MKKRLLSALLCLCMVLPTTAMAGDYHEPLAVDGYVLTKELTCDENGVAYDSTVYEYDAHGNTTKETFIGNEDGHENARNYTNEYDTNGNLVKKQWSYNSGWNDEDEQWKIEYEYDESNNLTKETTYCYDTSDNSWDVNDFMGYEYDVNGNITKEIYRSGYYVVYTYNENGSMAKETGYDEDGTVYKWTLYSYDGNGHMTKKQYRDNGIFNGHTECELDANGNITKSRYYDKNGEIQWWIEETRDCEYDEYGNRIKEMYYWDSEDDPICYEYTYVKLADIIASGGFYDVPSSAYYAEPVSWALSQNITNGTSTTTFSPDDTCTRGQIVTFLWRAKGEPEPTGTKNPFVDVSSDAYYYKAVLWAVENGVTAGTSKTTFSPEDGCTRAQVATFLWRAENKPSNSGNNPFADVPSGQWYSDAVLWAVDNGITNGTSATTFAPDTTCTRGQIVTFLYRDMA